MSSLFGHLIRYQKQMTDDEELFCSLDISRINDPRATEFKLLDTELLPTNDEGDYRTRYTYIKSEQPYKYVLARMKPFFMSYSRLPMATLVLSEGIIHTFIRAHTDNITLTEPHDFTHLKYYPLPEEKPQVK